MELIKHRVAHYWSHRAEGFETQRLREFESEKKDRWLAEFARYLPQGRPLRILDVGTGTGFFACLLAEQGHETTGIDLTPEMIDHAEHMAAVLGVDASFTIMDAEEPEFEAESFDVLVTRNLTWTLPHIEKAYREWFRVLKPGGLLINFDADYSAALESWCPTTCTPRTTPSPWRWAPTTGRAPSGTYSCWWRRALSASRWTWACTGASTGRSMSSLTLRRSSPSRPIKPDVFPPDGGRT